MGGTSRGSRVWGEQFLAALRSVQERLLDHPESFLSCTATPGAPECHVTGEMIGR